MALFSRKDQFEKTPKKLTAGLTIKVSNFKKSYVKYMTSLGAHVFHLAKYSVYRLSCLLKRIKSAIVKKVRANFIV